ncbi:MAG: formylglycine-generating enzyme family protein [bacterium]|nr:formylglycine-generating enzyme family protein [bacterium]
MQTPEPESADIYAEKKDASTILIPDIAWIEIPAGDFIFGQGTDQKTLHLDTFWIGKYPVTNSQYKTFIDAGGYEDERWWADITKPELQASRWNQPNRPKTNVNWYEVVAFTRWFSAILGYTHNEIHLPREQEWEKAARGTQGLIYPWGKDYRSGYANTNETFDKAGEWNLEQTTAAGLYPHGRSPYGVMDMAGNVWEWCVNKYNSPETITPDKSGDIRVLRGGSWFNFTGLARVDYRYWNDPDDRDGNWGFRVLSSVPIADR